MNIGIFGPIEDSVNLIAIIETLLQLGRGYAESSLEEKSPPIFIFVKMAAFIGTCPRINFSMEKNDIP